MDYSKDCRDVVSEFSVEVPDESLVVYCRKGYMKDLFKTAFVSYKLKNKTNFIKFVVLLFIINYLHFQIIKYGHII